MKIGVFYHHILEAASQTGQAPGAVLDAAAAAGICCLTLDAAHYQVDPAAFADMAAAHGFGVAAAARWLDLRGDYPSDEARAVLDALGRMNARHLLALPVFPDAGNWDAQRAATADNLKRLSEQAAAYGVQVSLEDFDNAASPYANTDGLRFFLQNAPQLGVTFDTGNFIFSEEDAQKALAALLPRVVCVHCKDRSLAPVAGAKPLITVSGRAVYPSPVGAGCIPMTALLGALKAAGYDGELLIEHYGSPDMLGYMLASAAFLKETWAALA